MRKLNWVVLLAMLTHGASCKQQTSSRVPCNGTSPTWNSKVLDIVATNCWGSSCHGTGANNGDYTTYSGIKPDLLSGSFARQVLDDRFMPQGAILPDTILAVLHCWVEKGFPEN